MGDCTIPGLPSPLNDGGRKFPDFDTIVGLSHDEG